MNKNNKSYYDLFCRELYQPMFLTEPPRFLSSTYNTPIIVSRYRILRYYNKLRNETGNTLFLIRIGTFENLTKSLQKNDVIQIVYPVRHWSTEFFEGFHSKKISELIRLVTYNSPFAIGVPRSSLSIENHTWCMNVWYYHRLLSINRLEYEIIKTIIPNFELKCKYKPEKINLAPIYRCTGQ